MSTHDNDPLNAAQVRETNMIAELHVRQYFDHYLQNIQPEQARRAREHVNLMIQMHDDADDAHGSVERKFSRVLWILMGAAGVGGAGGAGLMKLVLTATGT